MPDFGALFARAWRIERTISDRDGGRVWRAAGSAAFTPLAKGVAGYDESVVVSHRSLAMRASRAYVYRVLTPAILEIDFANGLPFCRLVFIDGAATAVHHCRDDEYRGGLTFESAERWRSHWSIRGPNKTLEIDTRYEVALHL